MAGMPYHAIERYVSALVTAGYRIAVAEQTSETKSSKEDTRPRSAFAGGRSVAGRRGKLCARPRKRRTFAYWRCGARAMARQVIPRRCIPTCSVMPACARSFGAQRALPIAQKQAGWSRLQLAYLSISDEEVRRAMRDVHD